MSGHPEKSFTMSRGKCITRKHTKTLGRVLMLVLPYCLVTLLLFVLTHWGHQYVHPHKHSETQIVFERSIHKEDIRETHIISHTSDLLYQEDMDNNFDLRSVKETIKDLSSASVTVLKNKRILFVTTEISISSKSSEVARQVHAEAVVFLSAGANVTILYTPSKTEEPTKVENSYYHNSRIKVVYVKDLEIPAYGTITMQKSYAVYLWLKSNPHSFDIVIVQDKYGIGLYILYAKNAGIAFRDIPIVVQCHGSLKFENDYETKAPKDHNTLITYFMERKSVELADFLATPTETYGDWMAGQGYSLHAHKKHTFDIPLDFDEYESANKKSSSPVKRVKSTKICFCDRLAHSSGAFFLVNTLKEMVNHGIKIPDQVIFIGEQVTLGQSMSSSIITKTLQSIKVNFSVFTDVRVAEMLQLVKKQDCILVMPSFVETISSIFHDCINAGIPVLHSNIDSFTSQLETELPAELSFLPGDEIGLAHSLTHAMADGVPILNLKVPKGKTAELYQQMVSYILSDQHKKEPITELKDVPKYLVTVVITTHDRPETLIEALDAILNQTYKYFKVLIADSSTDQRVWELVRDRTAIFEKTNIVLLYLHVGIVYVSQARNKGFANIDTEYGILLDDDDVPAETMVEHMLITAVRTKASIVTGFSLNFKPGPNGTKTVVRSSLSVGNAFEAEFFMHHAGKSNMLMRKKVFLDVGGCTVVAKGSESPYVDWDLYFKLMLHGFVVEVVPEPTFYYRLESKNSIYYESSGDTLKNFNGHLKIAQNLCKYYRMSKQLCDTFIYAKYRLSAPKITDFG